MGVSMDVITRKRSNTILLLFLRSNNKLDLSSCLSYHLLPSHVYTSYNTIACRVVPYQTRPDHIVSYCEMSYRVMSCLYGTTLCHVMSSRTVPYGIVSCHPVPYCLMCTTSCHCMPYRIVPHCVVYVLYGKYGIFTT